MNEERRADARDSIAIVTGAGSGIGRATARRLAASGVRVTLVGRREDALEQTAAEMPPGSGLIVPEDLSAAGSVERVVAATEAKWGMVDTLVNNAGLARLRRLDEGIDEAAVREEFELNAIVPALLAARVWPGMLERGHGCIVNLSSMASIDPFEGFFAYSMSKSALNAMGRICRKEGGGRIRCFAIAPGCVETSMLRGLFSEAQVPAEIAVSPEAVASLVVDCIEGRRDEADGRVITILREEGEDVLCTVG